MIHSVCRHLPTGWILSLHMEHGAAWIEVRDPQELTWSEEEMDLCPDEPIEIRVDQAVEFAIAREENYGI